MFIYKSIGEEIKNGLSNPPDLSSVKKEIDCKLLYNH
jgi:hypothetical protein